MVGSDYCMCPGFIISEGPIVQPSAFHAVYSFLILQWFFLKFQGVINSYVDHHPSRRKGLYDHSDVSSQFKERSHTHTHTHTHIYIDSFSLVILEALMGVSSSFTEQQEQLKLIHEKFKDEINQHIQDCRSSIEGLEVHQIELKRNVERQSMTIPLSYESSLFVSVLLQSV